MLGIELRSRPEMGVKHGAFNRANERGSVALLMFVDPVNPVSFGVLQWM